jgi:hypothetical protein
MTVVAPGAGRASSLDEPLSTPRPMQVGPPREASATEAERQIAGQIQARWDAGHQLLNERRRSYWQNLAFYLGYQWVWWSAQRQMVMPLPVDYSPLGPGKAKYTANRFGPNIVNVLARLTRSELAFEVPPSDSADNIVGGAKLAAKLLECARVDQMWDRVRFDENLAKLLGGTSAVSIEWDGKAGTRLKLPEYDDGRDQYVGTGDARLRAFNITEFMVEPGVREARDARYWMSNIALPVGVVQEHYNLSWMPRSDATSQSGTLYSSLIDGSGRGGVDHSCNVITYYERPYRDRPGVYVVVVNGVCIHKAPWPFPFERLNLEVFRQKRRDGKWFGHTYADDAVPIQSAYNFARSVVQDYMRELGKMRMAAPIGSFDEGDLSKGPDAVLWYAPDGMGGKPEYVVPPNVPRTITDEPDKLQEELDNAMLVHDVSRGVGFSRVAASALTFLAEQDDSGLSPMVFEEKDGWASLGRMYLELCGAKVTETRESVLPLSKSTTEKIRWTGRELQGQVRVVVPLDAVNPINSAARQQNAKELWDRKIVTDPRIYARMSGLPPDEFEQLLDPDSARANEENLRMMLGVPCLPEDFDDHAVHIAEHNDRLRKTDSYLYAPAEIRQLVDDHIAYHEKKAANEQARQTALAGISPAAAAVPQASAPVGSDVPMGEEEMMRRAGATASLGVTPDGTPMGGAPAVNRSPEAAPAVTGGGV